MEIKVDKSNWKKVKLGDVAFEYSNRINNPSESEYNRFVGSSNIGQWDFRIKSWESTKSVTSAMKLFEPNDYLLVRRSLYASDFRERAPRADFHGVCSGDILTIKENPEKIVDGFLIGIFNSPALWKYVVANASGSITRRIKWKDLANYEFLLPPKDQQAKLAELLWAMDEVIESDTTVLEGLKNDDLSYLKHYFYDDKTSERIKLKHIVSMKKGRKPPVLLEEGKGLPYCTAKYLRTGEIEAIVPEEAWSKSIKIDETDILVLWDGSNAGEMLFGKDGFLASTMCKLKIKKNDYLKDFVFQFLRFKTNDIKRATVGSAIPHVDPGMIENIEIPKLSLQDQETIIERFNLIKNNINLIESKIQSSKALQKSLINQVF